MSRGPQFIEFEGLFQEGVLGIFRVVRGFADLKKLAEVSVPYTMEETQQADRVFGHQRKESLRHAEEIKKYLEASGNRFFPEIILSVRVPVKLITSRGEVTSEDLGLGEIVFGARSVTDSLVEISRLYSSATMRMQSLRVRIADLQRVRTEKVIRRIDGNHRLYLADQLKVDPNSPSKYLAPFCMILLNAPNDEGDDFAESLIFHTINSMALPLDSEHGLKLLLGQNPANAPLPDEEFSYSPELHLTRLMVARLNALPRPARERFGDRPLTALLDSARNLIAMEPSIIKDRATLKTFADDLFAALLDISTKLKSDQPSLCSTYGFFELAARVWLGAEGHNHETRVSWAVDYLDRIGDWLGGQGITNMLDPLSPAQQLLETFKAAQAHIPKRVFLARWYPPNDAPDNAWKKANFRLKEVRQALTNVKQQFNIELELVDLGTEEGAAFPIHKKMYEAIASSDIVICDLTGHRPNVYIEAGYALSQLEKKRLILLFEPYDASDKVPFDLSTFKYVQVTEAAEIPDRLGTEIVAILRESGATLDD